MAITGLLSGFNEQRQSTGNYLAQLDQMRRAQIAQQMDQQRMEEQQNQFAQEMALRQQQAERQSAQQQQEMGLRSGQADLQNREFSLKEKSALGAMQRDEQARNALQAMLAGGGDVDLSQLGRAVLPYDMSGGANLIKSGREEQRQQSLLDRTGGTGVNAPQGYRWTRDGNLEAIPGGGADPMVMAQMEAIKRRPDEKQVFADRQKMTDANDVMRILDMAEPFVDEATGSYIGAGLNVAGQAFGFGGESAKANARLKALEGALISKMPKMSGPQSDKDVLLYKQMAGQIGDPTIPANVKRAAMDTIRELNQRAASSGAEASEQQSQARQEFNSMPDPRQYEGKTVRDTSSGVRWTSNGREWMRAK